MDASFDVETHKIKTNNGDKIPQEISRGDLINWFKVRIENIDRYIADMSSGSAPEA